MRIVLATAEPRGAYHLTPFDPVVRTSEHEWLHLVPYPESLQGCSAVSAVSDVSVLERADVVVITGGTLSAWTELVARYANDLGLRTCFSEVSYLRPTPHHCPPRFDVITAVSKAGAQVISAHLDVPFEKIIITGTPLTDSLPPHTPLPRRVLLLSTSEATQIDPDGNLRSLGLHLLEQGFDVSVRCHPREDSRTWEGFTLDSSASVIESAALASAVVCYPRTASAPVAALGVPVVSLVPGPEATSGLPASLINLGTRVNTWQEAAAALNDAPPVPREDLVDILGPVGGSALRTVSHWVG